MTIVTPTFNRAAELQQALASVLSQSVLPCEHIICDNLSEDFTATVVGDYAANAPFPVVYLRQRDTGMYQAMNRALERATGDSIFVLNDDDQLHNSEVLRRFGACLAETEADLVYGDTVWLDPTTQRRQYRRHNQINKATLVHKTISQQAIIYSKAVFAKCGAFDESFRIAGDYDWLLRAFLKHQIFAVYLNRPMALCSLGGLSNSSSAADRRRAERRQVIQRWYSEREVKLSGWYRKYLRRFPFGTALMNCLLPIKLRIRSVRDSGGRLRPDLAALLGF